MSLHKGDEESQTTSGNGSSQKKVPWWKKQSAIADPPKASPDRNIRPINGNLVDSLSDERAQTEYKLMLKTKTLLHSIEIGNAELAKSLIDELQDARLLVKSTGFAIQDISGNGILQIAAMRNRLDMVKLLISRGFDINNVDRNHGTALQVSLYLDHSRITKYLLDPASISLDIAAVRTNDSNTQTSKIDVNVSGGLYGTALQVAAYKGSKKWIQELLGKGANAMIRCGKYGSVLQAAARTGLPNVVELILDEDIDPNWQGGSYSTALQACAKGAYTTRTTYVRNLAHGRILNQDAPNQVLRAPSSEKPDYTKVATMLIAKGARVNSGGGKYGSPMNAAASSGNIEMVKLLLREDRSTEKEHQHAYDCALLSAITQTFSTSRLELVEQLVDNKADISFEAGSGLYNRPFMAAAAMNDSKVLEYLWKKAQTLDIGPIYLNAQSGIYGTALRAALSKRAKDTAKLLIGWGADLMSCDPSYGNVLHLATFSGMEDIVELLLKKNIDVNIQDNCQQTPLHIAAYFARTSIAQVLLNNRANTELRDAWDMTPLDIVDQVMHRESHPGPSLDDLRQMKQLLVTKRSTETVPSDELTFKGPRIIKPHASVNKTPEELLSCPEKGKPTGKARSVYSSPIWNPGLSFKADIIDFLVKDDEEYVKMERIKIDDLLYRESVLDEVMKTECVENGTVSKQDNKLKLSVRWIHLPSNNMTWVDSLLNILWKQYRGHEHSDVPCQSFWGTDPYFVSPDLAPHARFVTPQCERLLHDSHQASDHCTAIFLAIPYIHWESYHAQGRVSLELDNIKREAIRTRILKLGRDWNLQDHIAGVDEAQTSAAESKKNTAVKNDDDEMMRRYLYKRWPIHLRRTLDQYYFSFLADTKNRDGDQVVTRARNIELNLMKKEATVDFDDIPSDGSHTSADNCPSWLASFFGRLHNKSQKTDNPEAPSTNRQIMQEKDPNSPVVMIDQLWLWVLDEGTIVTAFPSRRAEKNDGDLDTEDKTDIMNTIRSFLHSTKRHPIQNSYDLAELITAQCVAILHRADVIPELDFLKIFSSRSNEVVDEVMKRLTDFVNKFEDFMKKLNREPRSSTASIKDFENLFSVTYEASLLREIQDIKDELKMLSEVFLDQQCVLQAAGKKFSEDRDKKNLYPSSTFKYDQQSLKHGNHVERMLIQANQAYDTLRDLLNLKQQQANVLEARVSRNQQIASEEQGQTILVFTIVTIIFLPLTFMTTVFTLPILEFPRYDPETWDPKPDGGLLKSGYAFGIIVGLTMVMAFPLVYIALKIQRLKKTWNIWVKGEKGGSDGENPPPAALEYKDKGLAEGTDDYNRSGPDSNGLAQRIANGTAIQQRPGF